MDATTPPLAEGVAPPPTGHTHPPLTLTLVANLAVANDNAPDEAGQRKKKRKHKSKSKQKADPEGAPPVENEPRNSGDSAAPSKRKRKNKKKSKRRANSPAPSDDDTPLQPSPVAGNGTDTTAAPNNIAPSSVVPPPTTSNGMTINFFHDNIQANSATAAAPRASTVREMAIATVASGAPAATAALDVSPLHTTPAIPVASTVHATAAAPLQTDVDIAPPIVPAPNAPEPVVLAPLGNPLFVPPIVEPPLFPPQPVANMSAAQRRRMDKLGRQGCKWASPTAFIWMKAQLPGFVQAQANSSTPEFLSNLYIQYEDRFSLGMPCRQLQMKCAANPGYAEEKHRAIMHGVSGNNHNTTSCSPFRNRKYGAFAIITRAGRKMLKLSASSSTSWLAQVLAAVVVVGVGVQSWVACCRIRHIP